MQCIIMEKHSNQINTPWWNIEKPTQKCNFIKAITAYTHEEVAKIKDSAKIYTSNPTG